MKYINSILFYSICGVKKTPDGSLEKYQAGGPAVTAGGKSDAVIQNNVSLTTDIHLREATRWGLLGKPCQLFWRLEKPQCRGRQPDGTFQDVNALLVGWVCVWVVGGCEHPTVDVAHPCATVVLIGDLTAMFTRGFLKAERQGRDKQMGYWAEWIDEGVIEDLSDSKRKRERERGSVWLRECKRRQRGEGGTKNLSCFTSEAQTFLLVTIRMWWSPSVLFELWSSTYL